MSEGNGMEVAPSEVVANESVASQAGTDATATAAPAAVECESPPASAMPERVEIDPRARLLELAATLMRSQNRRLVVEYLRLRRAVA
jgi:hypothetical protein